MTALMDMLLEQFILDIREHLEKGIETASEIEFLSQKSDFIKKHFADDNLLLAAIKEI